MQSTIQRRTPRALSVIAALAVPAFAVLAGCATDQRDHYYGARKTIISAALGDASSIESRAQTPAPLARAQDAPR
jgi:hypothetical protein